MNWKCRFLCSKETRRTCRKTLGARRRVNNKLSPHVGHGGERQAFSPPHHSHSPVPSLLPCTIPTPLYHLYSLQVLCPYQVFNVFLPFSTHFINKRMKLPHTLLQVSHFFSWWCNNH